MAAENCGIREGDTVAVWGCGPVGQFAIKSAYMLGAAQVIAIDHCYPNGWRWPNLPRQAQAGYKLFNEHKGECIKIALKP